MIQQFTGLNKLLTENDDCTFENHTIIEGELSEYASLVYDVTTDEYFIESEELAELEEYDDITVAIDPDTFEGMEVGKCKVTKKDLEDFKVFLKELKDKGKL